MRKKISETGLFKEIGLLQIGKVRIYEKETGHFVVRKTLWSFEEHYFIRDGRGDFYKLDIKKYTFERD